MVIKGNNKLSFRVTDFNSFTLNQNLMVTVKNIIIQFCYSMEHLKGYQIHTEYASHNRK
jgi:hypothetical protein